jgi:NAD(P)H-dependent FMN reductase
MLYIPVVLGSIRQGRNTPRLARFMVRKLDERDEVRTELIDLHELQLPLVEERLRFLEAPPPGLTALSERVNRADAVVIATPEYNKGYPAALKNAIDALGSEWRRKPVGIVAHSVGAFGGIVVLQ